MARFRGFPGFVFLLILSHATCYALRETTGLGVGNMQELFTLLARRGQSMPSTRAGGRSLTDNPTTAILVHDMA